MHTESLVVGKIVVPKVLLESLGLQDMVRRMEFLKDRQASRGWQSLDLKEQLPEQADTAKEQLPEQVGKEATQDLRLRPRRWGLRSVQRQRGEHRRVCHPRTMGSGPPVRALGLQHRLRRRAGGTRRRRRLLHGRAPRAARRT